MFEIKVYFDINNAFYTFKITLKMLIMRVVDIVGK